MHLPAELPHRPYSSQPTPTRRGNTARNLSCPCPTSSLPSGAVVPAPLAGWSDRANVFATNSPHRRPSRQIRARALPCLMLAVTVVVTWWSPGRPGWSTLHHYSLTSLASLISRFVCLLLFSPVLLPYDEPCPAQLSARRPVAWPAHTIWSRRARGKEKTTDEPRRGAGPRVLSPICAPPLPLQALPPLAGL